MGSKPDDYLLSLEGGPPKPKPVYDATIVAALVSVVDSGARLLELGLPPSRSAHRLKVLWEDLEEARKLVHDEIKRRRRAMKRAAK